MLETLIVNKQFQYKGGVNPSHHVKTLDINNLLQHRETIKYNAISIRRNFFQRNCPHRIILSKTDSINESSEANHLMAEHSINNLLNMDAI